MYFNPESPQKDREPFWRAVAINAMGGLVAAFVILIVVALVGRTDKSNPRFRYLVIAGTADVVLVAFCFVGVVALFLVILGEDQGSRIVRFLRAMLATLIAGVAGIVFLGLLGSFVPSMNNKIADIVGYVPKKGSWTVVQDDPSPTPSPSPS